MIKFAFFPPFFFLFLSCLLFWRFFFQGLVLFPGSYQIAWFGPYKYEHVENGTIRIPHKPVSDDVFRHIYPFKVLAVDMMKKGQLPLWNPYNGSGMPLLATINSGLIDPFNILFFLLPYLSAWNLYLFLQFFFVGYFTYLYVKKLTLSDSGAFFSGTVMLFSGTVVARVSLGAYGLGIAMLPFLLFLLESYFENRKTKLILFIPFSVFSLITSTHPQISFYILALVTSYLFVKTVIFEHTWRVFFYALLYIFLGILLCAIQIFPTLELLHYANFSSETSTYVSKFLVPFYHVVSFFIPNYFGNAGTYNFWGKSDYIETVTALGTLPLFFAYLTFFMKKSPLFSTVIFFLSATLITLIIAIDSPLSHLFLSLPIPILSTDPPSRIFIITSFCLSVLGGIGFLFFFEKKTSFFYFVKRSLPYLFFLFSITTITAFLVLAKYQCADGVLKACFSVALRNTILEEVIFSIGFITLGIMAFLCGINSKRIVPWILIFFVVVAGTYNADKFLPFSPKDSVFPNSSIITQLRRLNTIQRVFGFSDATLTTDFATYYHIYDPDFYHPLYIKRYGQLIAYSNEGGKDIHVGRSDALINNSLTLPVDANMRRERLFALLGVEYFIFTKPDAMDKKITNIFWNNTHFTLSKTQAVLPKAYVLPDVVIKKDEKEILEELFSKNFNPFSSIVLEEPISISHSTTILKQSVLVNAYSENMFNLLTKTNRDGILLVNDNFYPGWKAFIDGKETRIYRANYTFRSILLPKGMHTVTFQYEPSSVRIGLILSCIAAVLIAIVYVIVRKRKFISA